jgi:hypothetical protein
MPISLKCSHCAQLMQAPDDRAGQQVRCPRCDATSTVPQQQSAESPEESPIEAEVIAEEPDSESPLFDFGSRKQQTRHTFMHYTLYTAGQLAPSLLTNCDSWEIPCRSR